MFNISSSYKNELCDSHTENIIKSSGGEQELERQNNTRKASSTSIMTMTGMTLETNTTTHKAQDCEEINCTALCSC